MIRKSVRWSRSTSLITAIGETYAPELEAIARRTMLRYRDRSTPVAAIAGELGVEYLVEGRVRSRDDLMRITVQLVSAEQAPGLLRCVNARWPIVWHLAIGECFRARAWCLVSFHLSVTGPEIA